MNHIAGKTNPGLGTDRPNPLNDRLLRGRIDRLCNAGSDAGLRRRELLTVAAAWPCASLAADLPSVIARTKASLCAVGTYNELSSPRFTFRGTGFFVGDGSAVATCWHVLPQVAVGDTTAGRLVVQLPAGGGQFEYREASVAASDRAHDLAVLKVSGGPRPPLAMADPTDVVEGLSVVFMGYPIGGRLGFTPVSHRGIVSSIITSAVQPPTAGNLTAGAIRQLRDGPFVLLQLDATAYPGNSGGPLLDAESGQVVGVISMVLVKGTRESALTHPSGISYAVPVQYLSALIKGS